MESLWAGQRDRPQQNHPQPRDVARVSILTWLLGFLELLGQLQVEIGFDYSLLSLRGLVG
nr:hypothetical protein DOP62_00495 [Synechococcus elongatus PCC 11801]